MGREEQTRDKRQEPGQEMGKGKTAYFTETAGILETAETVKTDGTIETDGLSEKAGLVEADGIVETAALLVDHVYFAYSNEENDEEENSLLEEPVEAEKNYILKDLSFQVQPGEFIALLGPNGSGKSSLAKLLNGQYFPDQGSIRIMGMDTREEDRLWDIRSQCGLVFQNPDNQMVSSIVEEDVAFGPENLGIPNPELRDRVDWALKAVGMYDFKDKATHDLSGGQKQRVAIAGLLAMKPACLVLDEPTSMLDPQGRQEIMESIIRLHQEEGMTILFITHDMEEAAQADRILVMHEGELVMDGKGREIFAQSQKLEELGLGLPQVTELTRGLRKAGLDLPPDIITTDQFLEALDGLTLREDHPLEALDGLTLREDHPLEDRSGLTLRKNHSPEDRDRLALGEDRSLRDLDGLTLRKNPSSEDQP